jgi:hypothetical protein
MSSRFNVCMTRKVDYLQTPLEESQNASTKTRRVKEQFRWCGKEVFQGWGTYSNSGAWMGHCQPLHQAPGEVTLLPVLRKTKATQMLSGDFWQRHDGSVQTRICGYVKVKHRLHFKGTIKMSERLSQCCISNLYILHNTPLEPRVAAYPGKWNLELKLIHKLYKPASQHMMAQLR